MTATAAGLSPQFAQFIRQARPGEHERARVIASVDAVFSHVHRRCNDQEVRLAMSALAPTGQGAVAPLGSDVLLSAPGAALVTGVAASEPAHSAAQRAEVAVIAAAFAAAELLDRSGSEFVDAMAIGVALGVRLVRALESDGYAARGWDATGAGGSIGAAAAVARLAQVSVMAAQQALGVAATQASGLGLAAETSGWALLVGKAASNGLEAAMLCAEGFSGPPMGIEGRRGLLAVGAPGIDIGRIVAGLGVDWALLDAEELRTFSGEPEHREQLTAFVAAQLTLTDLVASLRGSVPPTKP